MAALLFQDLWDALEAEGIYLTPDQMVDIQVLLDEAMQKVDLLEFGPGDFMGSLRPLLGPVIAKNPLEQKRFIEVFQKFSARFGADKGRDISINQVNQHTSSENQENDSIWELLKDVISVWEGWLALLALAAIGVALIFFEAGVIEVTFIVLIAGLIQKFIHRLITWIRSRKKVELRPPTFFFPSLPSPDLSLIDEETQPDVMTRFNHFRHFGINTSRVDIEKTVDSTVRQGGQVRLSYVEESTPPSYVILLEKRHLDSHQIPWFKYLSGLFQANGIEAQTYFFQRDPRICELVQAESEELWFLEREFYELEAINKGQRLLIVGDGDFLIDPFAGETYPWVRDLAESWEDCGFLSVKPLSEWSWKEGEISQLMPLVPATIEGLLALVDHFDELSDSHLEDWFSDTRALKIENPSIKVLRRQVSEPCFLWICACALYPEVYWELTLRLGNALQKGLETPLLTRDNLSLLTQVSWFRYGKMPDAVRKKLLRELSEADPVYELKARIALDEILYGKKGQEDPLPGFPTENTVAGHNLRLFRLTNRLQLRSHLRYSEEERDRILSEIKRLGRRAAVEADEVLQEDVKMARQNPKGMDLGEVPAQTRNEAPFRVEEDAEEEAPTSNEEALLPEEAQYVDPAKDPSRKKRIQELREKLENSPDLRDLSANYLADLLDLDVNYFLNASAAEGGVLGFLNRRSFKSRERIFYRKLKENPNAVQILAVGDSWYTYPVFLKDIVYFLEKERTFAVRTMGAPSMSLYNLLNSQEYLKALGSMAAGQFLLMDSGAYDLLANQGITRLIKPFSPERGDQAELYLQERFDELLAVWEYLLVQLFTDIANKFPGVKILVHGYDYPIPSDRIGYHPIQSLLRYLSGNGQWMKLPMEQYLNIRSPQLQRDILRLMVDRYNELLKKLSEAFDEVYYIDLRGITTDERDWHDELHPSSRAFRRMAERIRVRIKEIQEPESEPDEERITELNRAEEIRDLIARGYLREPLEKTIEWAKEHDDRTFENEAILLMANYSAYQQDYMKGLISSDSVGSLRINDISRSLLKLVAELKMKSSPTPEFQKKIHPSLFDKIRHYVANAEIKEAIALLRQIADSIEDESLQNEILLLKERFNELEKSRNSATISLEEYQVGINRLLIVLLETIATVEKGASDEDSISGTRPFFQRLSKGSTKGKDTIRQLLAKGETQKALEILQKLVESGNDEDVSNAIRRLQAKYIEVEQKNFRGVLTYEKFEQERNQISRSILELIDRLSNEQASALKDDI